MSMCDCVLSQPEARLGQKHYALMAKDLRNKTYAQAKPKNLTDDVWIEMINDTIIKVAGIETMEPEEEDDYMEPGMDVASQGTQPGGVTPMGPPPSGGALTQPPPGPPARPGMQNRPLIPGPYGFPMYARGPPTLVQPYPQASRLLAYVCGSF